MLFCYSPQLNSSGSWRKSGLRARSPKGGLESWGWSQTPLPYSTSDTSFHQIWILHKIKGLQWRKKQQMGMQEAGVIKNRTVSWSNAEIEFSQLRLQDVKSHGLNREQSMSFGGIKKWFVHSNDKHFRRLDFRESRWENRSKWRQRYKWGKQWGPWKEICFI